MCIHTYKYTRELAHSPTPPPFVQLLISLTVDTAHSHVWHISFACRISEKGPIKLRSFSKRCNTLQHTATHGDTKRIPSNRALFGSEITICRKAIEIAYPALCPKWKVSGNTQWQHTRNISNARTHACIHSLIIDIPIYLST